MQVGDSAGLCSRVNHVVHVHLGLASVVVYSYGAELVEEVSNIVPLRCEETSCLARAKLKLARLASTVHSEV